MGLTIYSYARDFFKVARWYLRDCENNCNLGIVVVNVVVVVVAVFIAVLVRVVEPVKPP